MCLAHCQGSLVIHDDPTVRRPPPQGRSAGNPLSLREQVREQIRVGSDHANVLIADLPALLSSINRGLFSQQTQNVAATVPSPRSSHFPIIGCHSALKIRRFSPESCRMENRFQTKEFVSHSEQIYWREVEIVAQELSLLSRREPQRCFTPAAPSTNRALPHPARHSESGWIQARQSVWPPPASR